MNFFKSVFADDPDSPTSSDREPSSNPTHEPTTSFSGDDNGSDSEPTSDQPNPSPVWTFGGLIKTLQVKSNWIDTYRRDLEEFGSGLKKETLVLREVASNSLDIGASKAQVSLESMGQALDSIGFVMADIITHGKESLIPRHNDNPSDFNNTGVNSARYSRFDSQLRAIQCDASTYVEHPDDVDDYNKWVIEFNLDGKNDEIEDLMRKNGSINGVYKRVVPDIVDHDKFWCRYFYRVYRLKQAENARAKLVKRAISTEDEEELSWDVDDEDEENGRKPIESTDNVISESQPLEKLKEKIDSEEKTETSECGKESDISVVSTQPFTEEDDEMGWDEIEDIGSDDEKKDAELRKNPNREDLRKRLSVTNEDEDLSWDIQDGDDE